MLCDRNIISVPRVIALGLSAHSPPALEVQDKKDQALI